MSAGRRAALFDAAGTLIELREPVGETYARIAAAHGAKISAWRLEDAFQRVRRGHEPPLDAARERDAWRDVVRQTFLAADSAVRVSDFDAAFDALWRHYAGADAWRERPGAREALAGLRERGFATAVVSNFDARLPALLAELGLAAHLDLVLLAAEAGAAKPDRRIFDEALRRLGVAAADAVFVGDDAERDLAGATSAGLRALDVRALATLADLPRRLATTRAGEPPTGNPTA